MDDSGGLDRQRNEWVVVGVFDRVFAGVKVADCMENDEEFLECTWQGGPIMRGAGVLEVAEPAKNVASLGEVAMGLPLEHCVRHDDGLIFASGAGASSLLVELRLDVEAREKSDGCGFGRGCSGALWRGAGHRHVSGSGDVDELFVLVSGRGSGLRLFLPLLVLLGELLERMLVEIGVEGLVSLAWNDLFVLSSREAAELGPEAGLQLREEVGTVHGGGAQVGFAQRESMGRESFESDENRQNHDETR